MGAYSVGLTIPGKLSFSSKKMPKFNLDLKNEFLNSLVRTLNFQNSLIIEEALAMINTE